MQECNHVFSMFDTVKLHGCKQSFCQFLNTVAGGFYVLNHVYYYVMNSSLSVNHFRSDKIQHLRPECVLNELVMTTPEGEASHYYKMVGYLLMFAVTALYGDSCVRIL